MRLEKEAGVPSCRALQAMGGKLKFCSKGLGKTLRVFKQGSEM